MNYIFLKENSKTEESVSLNDFGKTYFEKVCLQGRILFENGEEIHVFHATLKKRDDLIQAAKTLFNKVNHPCLAELQVGVATSVVANYIGGRVYSHWLRKDYCSDPAKNMLEKINSAIQNENGTAIEICREINIAISDYSIYGNCIYWNHLSLILEHMIGAGEEKKKVSKLISDNCVSFRIAPFKGYVYDYEEIWYYFMRTDETRRVIEGRRYRDMQELVRIIDEKIKDHEDDWLTRNWIP